MWQEKIDPQSPVVLLDKWLDERGFTHRQLHSMYDYKKTYTIIQLFRPHGKEWLFSLGPSKSNEPLVLKLWGPGMICRGMIKEFHLADPKSFDDITSTISAWRKIKFAALKEVWRYINIIEHNTCARPKTDDEAWSYLTGKIGDPDLRYTHPHGEDFTRLVLVLKANNIHI